MKTTIYKDNIKIIDLEFSERNYIGDEILIEKEKYIIRRCLIDCIRKHQYLVVEEKR